LELTGALVQRKQLSRALASTWAEATGL